MASRFAQRLALIPKEMFPDANASLLKHARPIARGMRSIVTAQSFDEGNLAASIRLEPHPNKLRVLIRAGGDLTTKAGPNSPAYDYALGIEFGTSDTDAEPFFYPTWRAYRDRTRRAIARDLKASIEKAAKKP